MFNGLTLPGIISYFAVLAIVYLMADRLGQQIANMWINLAAQLAAIPMVR